MNEPGKTFAAFAVMAAMCALVIAGSRAGRVQRDRRPDVNPTVIEIDSADRPPGHRVIILPDTPPEGALHCYGGGVEGMPACPTCNEPYAVLLSIDARDPAIDYLHLPTTHTHVITCLGCDVYTQGVLFYRVAPKIVILSAPESRRGHPIEHPCPPRAVKLRRLTPEEYPSHYPSVDDWEHFLAGAGERKHQLGGPMFKIRGDRRMACPECGLAMRFLAQIESETWTDPATDETAGHTFGPRGVLYLKACDACRIYGTAAEVP